MKNQRTCPQSQTVSVQGTCFRLFLHLQNWILVLLHSPHDPSWHILSHKCCLHGSSRLHVLLHDQCLFEHRRATGWDLEQLQLTVTIFGQGGHGPITYISINHSLTASIWFKLLYPDGKEWDNCGHKVWPCRKFDYTNEANSTDRRPDLLLFDNSSSILMDSSLVDRFFDIWDYQIS